MIEISVIMPIYNVEKYLSRAIDSVIEQTYSNWELILVNDGSTDNSGLIAKQYAEQSNKITLINQKNMGSGLARQNGLNISKGKYICFIDPDDFLAQNALENNQKIMSEFNPDIIANGYIELKNSFPNKVKSKKYIPMLEGLYTKSDFRNCFSEYEKVGLRSLWNKLYNKEFLFKNNIKFTDQKVGQDALFNLEVYQYVNYIYIDKKVYYHYDNTRKDSAVKTYRPKRKDYEYNIAEKYRNLIETWNLENRYKKNIEMTYWKVVMSELLNLSNNASSFTRKEKIEMINHLVNDPQISTAIANLNTENFNNKFLKLCFQAIKNESYSLALNLMKVYKVVRQ